MPNDIMLNGFIPYFPDPINSYCLALLKDSDVFFLNIKKQDLSQKNYQKKKENKNFNKKKEQ